MRHFDYVRPATLPEALAAIAQGEARALCGGTDLIPQLREKRLRARRIVDLKRLPELTAIAPLPNGGLAIGAAVTATAVAQHAGVVARYPAVAQSARLIGSVQIQNRATLGGNICNAAPSADAVPALICHRARALIAGPNGRRELPLQELFAGPGRVVLGTGELLISILLPPAAPRSAAHYLRFTPRREMDIAIAGAGAWVECAAAGKIAAARIVLAAVAPVPLRARLAEQRLLGERPSPTLLQEAGRLAAAEARPISDTRGSADYRRVLVEVLTRRALAQCCGQLGLAEPA